ncbi:hypothetical protein JHJ32_07670 [Parapedobacter sp. ISTM3]|uniref:hypothetical protein n=1 Tax=Parapedobacter sp. ISTM3 TaxID=2800130 RepID=UPI001907D72B|nr:hypothetical protein [Parapedobacter sp. ISTM3]MBK1439856.1 hypothetical protein [Parapedobacter sp. ISTM3]
MAGKDNIEELIDYLKSLGFEGEKFEAEIRKKHRESDASFTVRHETAFGEETMRYELRFVHDRQFMAYRLESYKATHRLPFTIDHTTINGIDTAELEKRMAGINWYRQPERAISGIGSDEYKKVISDLWQLTAEPDFDGEQIQSQLIFKYWPEDNWDDLAKELQHAYENSRTFRADERGICDAILAFSIVSGRLDDLYESIRRTGLEYYPGINLGGLIASSLTSNPDSFEISCSTEEEDGIVAFRIPVEKTDGGYHADINHATFTPFPEIQHGVFDGIDSRDLEERMKHIDWKADDGLYEFNEQEDVVLLPHIRAIKDSIQRLNGVEESKEIADYLQVKYWSDSFMEIYVQEDVWQMKDWNRVEQRFGLSEDTRVISNLLRGRPVHARQFNSHEHDLQGWFIIDPTAVSSDGLNPMELVRGLTRAQVETMVNMLPLDGTVFVGDLVRSILRGEEVPLNLAGVDGEQQVFVSAPENPAEKKLGLRTAGGKPIPFNFMLDPGWVPKKAKQNVRQQETAFFRGKRNRKGI